MVNQNQSHQKEFAGIDQQGGINVRQYFYVITKYKWLILSIVIFIGLLSINMQYYTYYISGN